MSDNSDDVEVKRQSKCPGCGHPWGIPSKFCEGREKGFPRKTAGEIVDGDEEERQEKERKLAFLQRRVEEKPANREAARL